MEKDLQRREREKRTEIKRERVDSINMAVLLPGLFLCHEVYSVKKQYEVYMWEWSQCHVWY